MDVIKTKNMKKHYVLRYLLLLLTQPSKLSEAGRLLCTAKERRKPLSNTNPSEKK